MLLTPVSVKSGHSFRSPHATWDPRRHLYEELSLHPPGVRRLPPCPGSDGTVNGRGMRRFFFPPVSLLTSDKYLRVLFWEKSFNILTSIF